MQFLDAYLVAAAVDVQVGGSRNTSNEGEDGAEDVEGQREDRVDHERLLDGDETKVEKREHAEDGDEHVIVDDRRTAGNGDHVTDEGHAEQDPEELDGKMLVVAIALVEGLLRQRAIATYLESSKTNLDERHGCGECIGSVVGVSETV